MQKGNSGNEQKRKLTDHDQQTGQNDDYRRDGAHLGDMISDPEKSNTSGTQKGGGGTGYDVNREQQEVNREQEIMHNERDNDQLNPERTQTPQVDPGKVNPDQEPGEPKTQPDSSTPKNYNRNANGAWSQSSWDSNMFR